MLIKGHLNIAVRYNKNVKNIEKLIYKNSIYFINSQTLITLSRISSAGRASD